MSHQGYRNLHPVSDVFFTTEFLETVAEGILQTKTQPLNGRKGTHTAYISELDNMMLTQYNVIK